MAAPPAILWTVLGSGTVVPDRDRHPAAHLMEAAGVRALVDCGAGTLSRLAGFGIPWQNLTHVILTHFHDDHVGGLRGLVVAWQHGMIPARARPVTLVGPPGITTELERLRVLPESGAKTSPPFDIRVVEMAPGTALDLGGVDLSCHTTPHTDRSLAYRFGHRGGSVGYTGDTGPSGEVAAFLAGCDLVVAECSLDDPPPLSTHLSPATLAAMARVMDPRLLILTHVLPTHLTPERAVVGVGQAGWAGRVVAAVDGLEVEVRPGHAAVREHRARANKDRVGGAEPSLP